MDDLTARPSLDPVEQRVIGSLLEKERTVPATYPLTANALRTACNQSSSRDPVTDLDDRTILDALERLKAAGLARFVHPSHGARGVKYRQVLDERLGLEDDERAVLTVLLLRGPSAAGELKTRCERLHGFADRDEVEEVLIRLARRPEPLVEELPAQPGQRDTRWIHLLGPVDLTTGTPAPAGGAPVAAPPIDPVARDASVIRAYDAVADAYADALLAELDRKPFDRWLLERVADLADGGPVVDAGCGPGQVGFHLAAAGADVTGIDLSPAMVATARSAFPELRFEVGDLTALPAPPDGSEGWAAIVAWYSLVHLDGPELAPALAMLTAALRPGGWLAFAVHLGAERRRVDELFGQTVDLEFVLHDAEVVRTAVDRCRLDEVERYRRSPLPAVEVDTERMYVLGRRPPVPR